MEDILNSLLTGEILYTTAGGTPYLFIKNNNFGVTYIINEVQKILPRQTIYAALDSYNMGEEINAQWYKNFNQNEYNSRPCNLSVLKRLLERL